MIRNGARFFCAQSEDRRSGKTITPPNAESLDDEIYTCVQDERQLNVARSTSTTGSTGLSALWPVRTSHLVGKDPYDHARSPPPSLPHFCREFRCRST